MLYIKIHHSGTQVISSALYEIECCRFKAARKIQVDIIYSLLRTITIPYRSDIRRSIPFVNKQISGH